MSTITCKLFGVPQILKDGQPVFLPYSKINALLYYVLVSKVVSREELAGLLWPDEMDETARRNLRNAIYQAKKALGTNLILSPKKSLLMLNEIWTSLWMLTSFCKPLRRICACIPASFSRASS